MNMGDILKELEDQRDDIVELMKQATSPRANSTFDKLRSKMNAVIKDLEYVKNTLPRIASDCSREAKNDLARSRRMFIQSINMDLIRVAKMVLKE